MTDRTLYVGTVGEGLWRSKDLGESYERLSNGLFIEADVRAIVVHPSDRKTLYAGTNCGIYKSEDAGQSWRLLNAGFGSGWPRTTDQEVWSLAIVPEKPDVVFAGVCPAAIYRSIDAGETWRLSDTGIRRECGPIMYSRVTCLSIEPGAAAAIWAGVEIDGIRVSNDLGETWESRSEGLSSLDIHSLLIRGQ